MDIKCWHRPGKRERDCPGLKVKEDLKVPGKSVQDKERQKEPTEPSVESREPKAQHWGKSPCCRQLVEWLWMKPVAVVGNGGMKLRFHI